MLLLAATVRPYHSPWQSISGAFVVLPDRTVTLTGGHGALPA